MPIDPTQSAEPAVLRQNPRPHPLKPKLCRQHASVNPGACPACVLAEYYEAQLALRDEKIQMLQGTLDKLMADRDL
jgi:hypothetical protein